MDEQKIKEIEKRTIDEVEWRVEKDDGKPIKLIGYAAIFNVLSLPMMYFRERILKGAFTKSLKRGDDVRALVDHDSSKLIGRRSSGTLKVTEDKKGLKAEIDLPNTTVAKDVTELIERGDLTGMSIGFRTISDRWHIEDEQEVRELVEIELRDVSVVTFPAYPDTDVAVRSHELWQQEQENRAESLKAIPYSRHGDSAKQKEDVAWDGGAETKKADTKQLAKMCLFEDTKNKDTKGAYKGPHHTADGNKVNWNGVRAAMAALMGARGGFGGVSKDELKKGYNHLVKHYKQFDKKPPEFKSRSIDIARRRLDLAEME